MQQQSVAAFKPKLYHAPEVIDVFEGEYLPADHIGVDNWDKGLPRTVNPATKKDDTEARKLQCELAHPLKYYNNEKQVVSLRRGLYMSMVYLRTSSSTGYVLDKQQERMVVRPLILQ